MKNLNVKHWCLVLLAAFLTSYANAQKTSGLIQPNIIIFYADDLGWQDIQLNDLDEPCAWDTPNITKLAKDAINFTNGYSPAPTCAPSRCSIVSGLHPAKSGVLNVNGGGIPTFKKSAKYTSPFMSGGLKPEHFTIAEALKMNGYKTGHVGKWHAGSLQIQSSSNQGFDFAYESRGTHQGPKGKKNRVNNFATHAKKDKFRLSEEKYFPFTKESPKGISYPKDEVTEKALDFIQNSKEEPFFLYLAHWMVHYPIHTKNKELLQYYCDKLGVEFPKEDIPMRGGGQTNPYFGSMVTTLDWSLGRVVDLLKKTDDPRNPGKKLYETTYIFFSSDNGGAEIRGREIMSDNAPLDKGKKYSEEGGIRVPMLVTGPNVSKGKTHHALINQLDFYPTILSLTNSKIPKKYSSNLDGLDISDVLINNAKEVKYSNGKDREDLWWHYPYGDDHKKQSAIRAGDYKLYKNLISNKFELYRLYKDGKREDLEEQFDIAAQEPKIVKDLGSRLEKYMKDYNAKMPYKNPLKSKDKASLPVVIDDSYDKKSGKASVQLEKGKSKIVESYAIVKYSDSNTAKGKLRKIKSTLFEEPVKASANKLTHTFTVPSLAIEYMFILVDENGYLTKGELHKIN